jgi:hypothetical protein
MVADSLFLPNGSLHVIPDVGLKPLQELFRAAVLKMLKKVGKIDDDFISIHNGVRIDRQNEKDRMVLAQ